MGQTCLKHAQNMQSITSQKDSTDLSFLDLKFFISSIHPYKLHGIIPAMFALSLLGGILISSMGQLNIQFAICPKILFFELLWIILAVQCSNPLHVDWTMMSLLQQHQLVHLMQENSSSREFGDVACGLLEKIMPSKR